MRSRDQDACCSRLLPAAGAIVLRRAKLFHTSRAEANQHHRQQRRPGHSFRRACPLGNRAEGERAKRREACLLYTSDAADERSSVDLGGRRIIKKKNKYTTISSRKRHIRQHTNT